MTLAAPARLAKRILTAREQHTALLHELRNTQWAGDALRESMALLTAAKNALQKHDARIRRLEAQRVARAAELDRAKRVSVRQIVGRIRSLSSASASSPPPTSNAMEERDDAAYRTLLQEERTLAEERRPLLEEVDEAEALAAEHRAVVHQHADALRALDALHDTIFAPGVDTTDPSDRRTASPPRPDRNPDEFAHVARIMSAERAQSRLEAEVAIEEEVAGLLSGASKDLAAALRAHGNSANFANGGPRGGGMGGGAAGIAGEAWYGPSTRSFAASAARKVERARELQPAVTSITFLSELANQGGETAGLLDQSQRINARSQRLLAIHATLETETQAARERRRDLARQTKMERRVGMEAQAALRALRIEIFEHVVAEEGLEEDVARPEGPVRLEPLPEYEDGSDSDGDASTARLPGYGE